VPEIRRVGTEPSGLAVLFTAFMVICRANSLVVPKSRLVALLLSSRLCLLSSMYIFANSLPKLWV